MLDLIKKHIDIDRYPTTYIKKDKFILKDIFDTYVILIKKGIVASEYTDIDGENIILYTYLPNTILLGLLYNIYGQNEEISIVALTKLEVVLIPINDVKELAEDIEYINRSQVFEKSLMIQLCNKFRLMTIGKSHIHLLYILKLLDSHINTLNKATIARIANSSRKNLYKNLKILEELNYIDILNGTISINYLLANEKLSKYLTNIIS